MICGLRESVTEWVIMILEVELAFARERRGHYSNRV